MENTDKTNTVSKSELIKALGGVVESTDALLELLLAGQEQLDSLDHRVRRLEMRLASCR